MYCNVSTGADRSIALVGGSTIQSAVQWTRLPVWLGWRGMSAVDRSLCPHWSSRTVLVVNTRTRTVYRTRTRTGTVLIAVSSYQLLELPVPVDPVFPSTVLYSVYWH